MGYDAFSPFAVAKVNVLCVPARRMSSRQFNQLFQSLKECPPVILKDIRPAQTNDADEFQPSRFSQGSILFNFSKTKDPRPAGSNLFEPNGTHQIVLGLARPLERSNDHNATSHQLDVDGEDQTENLESLQRKLNVQFGSQSHVLVCHLFSFQDHAFTSRPEHTSIIHAAQGNGSAYDALLEVARLLISRMNELATVIKGQDINPVRSEDEMLPSRGRNSRNPTPRPEISSTSGVSTPESRSPTPQSFKVETQPTGSNSRGSYSVVLGMLSLQCGCWSDAIRHFAEGIPILRRDYDHIWHARALEGSIVCMLLFAWSGIEFAIPQVCYPSGDRSNLRNSVKGIPIPNLGFVSNQGHDSSNRSMTSTVTLSQLMPNLVEMILDLYGSVSNFSAGEADALMREARVRSVNLLILLQEGKGLVEKDSLNSAILEHNPGSRKTEGNITTIPGVRKSDLAKILIDTLYDTLSVEAFDHQIKILVAVTSSLSHLGQNRKHGFYLRDLLHRIVPALIRARKIGASEIGIHPYTSHLDQSDGPGELLLDMKKGARRILSLVSEVYGLTAVQSKPVEDLDEIRQRLEQWNLGHNSGDEQLKLEILKLCINVSEAIPDIPAALYFTSQLLRCSKSIAMINPTRQSPSPLLSPEDQARYVDNLGRMINVAGRAKVHQNRAEYWDDFLVRDIFVSDDIANTKFTAHAPSEVALIGNVQGDGLQDPFIFNPFAKPKLKSDAPILVAGELATFGVTLQNPLEVEIEVEKISLLAEGCDFSPAVHAIVMGPFSRQTFILTGRPGNTGNLKIRGCLVTIKNCHEREFLFFPDHWEPHMVIKQRTGLSKRSKLPQGPSGSLHPVIGAPMLLVAGSLEPKIIPAQPRLAFPSNSLTDSSLMLLEGQKSSFQLNIRNMSSETAANFLLFTFQDNVTDSLQEALTSRDLLPIEVYEIQNQVQSKPVMKVKREMNQKTPDSLQPLQNISCAFEIYGRPGLMDATVQIDYAFLRDSISNIKETFHTRQLRFPLKITVNGSVEISRCNVVPINTDFTWWSAHKNVAPNHNPTSDSVEHIPNSHTTIDGSELFPGFDFRQKSGYYCILLLDLRNVWPRPLDVEFQARTTLPTDFSDENADPKFIVQETLQPGIVSRVALLVPRILIADPYAPIPRLKSQRQFVVSGSNTNIEAEAAIREGFWFREELLKLLQGTWKEKDTIRSGEIDLRKGIRLAGKMIEALKADNVDISFMLEPFPNDSGSAAELRQGSAVKQVGSYHFVLTTEIFTKLVIRVTNLSKEPLALVLRLQPALRNQVHSIALDLSKRFAWTGVLQQSLYPKIDPGESRQIDLGVIALAEGDYEIVASVEEIKGRRSAVHAADPEILTTGSERRIWHARKACLIDAVNSQGT